MPGDGLIDLPLIRRWVEAAEYRGPIEVQICSQRDWWTRDADVVVQTMLCRRSCIDMAAYSEATNAFG